jgi:carbon-monoxide dehydrogenase medium subunit
MKFSRFKVFFPDSVQEASELLREIGDDAKILAGGQSLLPMMAFRLVKPKALIDITNLGLVGVHVSPDQIDIGGCATHRQIETLQNLPVAFEALRDGMQVLGHVSIRNRGTVGGSLAHSDPSAEWPALALAFDAEIMATNKESSRTVEAKEFSLGWFTSSLEPDEIVTSVLFRKPGELTASSLVEVSRRSGDFALCGAICVLSSQNRSITQTKIVVFGVAETAVRLPVVEQMVIGNAIFDDPVNVSRVARESILEIIGNRSNDEKSGFVSQIAAPDVVNNALRKTIIRLQVEAKRKL